MGHKFSLGQKVVFLPATNEMLNVATRGKITRLMPMEGADYQYDVQIEADGLERRVEESRLRPLSSAGF